MAPMAGKLSAMPSAGGNHAPAPAWTPWPGNRIEIAVLVLVGACSLAYACLLPSFEGPDEPEHLAYVRAWATGGEIRRPVPGERFEWGYQITQPPLYYAIAGTWARLLRAEFPQTIALNATQNSRFPFIRHDLPGERFPWSGAHRGLRLLRLPSVLFGIATAWVLLAAGRLLFAGDEQRSALWVGLSLFIPAMQQAFSTVSNDGLAVLLGSAGIALAVAIVRRHSNSLLTLGACGLFLGLSFIAKYTAIIVVLTVATILSLDCALHYRRGTDRAKRALAFALPLSLVVGLQVLANELRFGEPFPGPLLREIFPALFRSEPAAVPWILGQIASAALERFGVDLCWQTCQVPWLSPLLLGAWGTAWAVSSGWVLLRCLRRAPLAAEHWLPIAALFVALAFITWVTRASTSLQLRHALVAWPLLALPFAQLPRISAALWCRARGWVLFAAFMVLALGHGSLWKTFRESHRPAAEPERDVDYHDYLYSHVRNRKRGLAYLGQGTHLGYDVERAFREGNWSGVVDLVERSAGTRLPRLETSFFYGASLALSGRGEDALVEIARIAARYPPARPLHVELALGQRGARAARELLKRYQATPEGPLREQLLRLESKLDRGPEAKK